MERRLLLRSTMAKHEEEEEEAGQQPGNAVPAGDGDEGINGRGSELALATGRLGYLFIEGG